MVATAHALRQVERDPRASATVQRVGAREDPAQLHHRGPWGPVEPVQPDETLQRAAVERRTSERDVLPAPHDDAERPIGQGRCRGRPEIPGSGPLTGPVAAELVDERWTV